MADLFDRVLSAQTRLDAALEWKQEAVFILTNACFEVEVAQAGVELAVEQWADSIARHA